MATTLKQPPTLDEAQYQALTQQCLRDLELMSRQMTQDQEDIDRLKAHTRANLTEIRSLAVETQTVLAKLKAA